MPPFVSQNFTVDFNDSDILFIGLAKYSKHTHTRRIAHYA